MPDALGSTHTGTTKFDNIPAELRLYDRDKRWVRITHGRKIFSQVMFENFKNNNITAQDPEPKYKSDTDRDILFSCAAVSDDMDGGTENKIWVADALAARISPNDQIVNQGVYYNGTTFSTTRSVSNSQFEVLFVIQKGVSDGTNTWFKVQRGWTPAAGGSAGTATEISTTMKLTLMPMTQPEGLDEAISYGDNEIEEQNYCQIFEEKWSVTETTQNTTILREESTLTRNGRKALDLFFKKFENAMQHGRKATGLQNGRRWWTTGGFEEYVHQAVSGLGYTANENVEDFTATYGAMSPQNFNSYCENKFYYGDGEQKFLILGATAYTKYCNSFDPKVRIVNTEMSNRYGLTITDHMGSNGGALHIVKSDDFSINFRGNEGYIVDFSHFQYMHLQNMDIQIIKDVETNPHETVNEIYGQCGVHRTNPKAHWLTYNF